MTSTFLCPDCDGEAHPIDEQGVYVCPILGKAYIDPDTYWRQHHSGKLLHFTRSRIERARKLYNARRRHHKRNWFRSRWDAMHDRERDEMCCYIVRYPWDPR